MTSAQRRPDPRRQALTDLADAVEAGIAAQMRGITHRALCSDRKHMHQGGHRLEVEEAIAAAYPVIVAAVREQVAQEIRSSCRHYSGNPVEDQYGYGYSKAVDDMAVIARGAS